MQHCERKVIIAKNDTHNTQMKHENICMTCDKQMDGNGWKGH